MKLPANARGLFRATGHATKPVPVLFDDGSFGKSANPTRIKDEFYPTPPEPTLALMAAEGARMREIGGAIWEPAAGDGAMARDIASCGFLVAPSDMVDRGCPECEIASFYDYQSPPFGARIQVTNPPYTEINWRDGRARWLRHSLEVLNLDYVALLLSWQWPGAAGLERVWHDHPPARVYLMRWKIDFTGQGAPPMLNAWMIWDRATYTGDTLLRMLDRQSDPRQTELT